MRYEIVRTKEFIKWAYDLKDNLIRARIAKRIARIADGNFGDHKFIGDKISELRLDFGPGYRIYYTQRENVIILLLCGGDKSTQSEDIKKAKQLAAEV